MGTISGSLEPLLCDSFPIFISGKKVMVLNGGYRGNEGILESINEKRFSVTITIDSVSIKHCKLLLADSFPSVRGELSKRALLSLILPYRWDLWCAEFCGHSPPITGLFFAAWRESSKRC